MKKDIGMRFSSNVRYVRRDDFEKKVFISGHRKWLKKLIFTEKSAKFLKKLIFSKNRGSRSMILVGNELEQFLWCPWLF